MSRKKSIDEKKGKTNSQTHFLDLVDEAMRSEAIAATAEYKKNDEAELIYAQAKGKSVKEMKDKLTRDLYLIWLRDEVNLSETEANRYIHIYSFEGIDISDKALKEAVKTSTPAMARQEMLDLGQQGQALDLDKVQEIKAKYESMDKGLDHTGLSKKWAGTWRTTQKNLLQKLGRMSQEFSIMGLTKYDMRDVLLSTNQDDLFNVDKFLEMLPNQ